MTQALIRQLVHCPSCYIEAGFIITSAPPENRTIVSTPETGHAGMARIYQNQLTAEYEIRCNCGTLYMGQFFR